MSDLAAAELAAERIIEGEWTEEDLPLVAQDFLLVLSRPADFVEELAGEPKWQRLDNGWLVFITPFGNYYVIPHKERFMWHFGNNHLDVSREVIEHLNRWQASIESADAAKQVCLADYHARLRKMMKGGE